MSRAHDGQRPFLPFGNPFKRIFPKSSYPSLELLHLQNSFEGKLAQRLEKLSRKEGSDILSSSWMTCAMESLCETHSDIKSLITDLKFPVTDWDEKWMDIYLDNSVKLLDICNGFNSELSRLDQSQLLLRYILYLLGQDKLEEAHGPLREWVQQHYSRNSKLDRSLSIIKGLAESLYPTKVKNSAKGKVLMRAMYGLMVHTVFICSVVMAVFSCSNVVLIDLPLFENFLWAEEFNNLQANVKREIKILSSCGRVAMLKEVETVHQCVEKLVSLTDVVDCNKKEMQTKNLLEGISDLSKNAERLTDGLDHLKKQVGDFFEIVLTGRDALLSNLRMQMKDNSL